MVLHYLFITCYFLTARIRAYPTLPSRVNVLYDILTHNTNFSKCSKSVNVKLRSVCYNYLFLHTSNPNLKISFRSPFHFVLSPLFLSLPNRKPFVSKYLCKVRNLNITFDSCDLFRWCILFFFFFLNSWMQKK